MRVFGDDARELAKQIQASIRQWQDVREAQGRRTREIHDQGAAALAQWKNSRPHSTEEEDVVQAQVQRTIAALNESTELGKANNEQFQQVLLKVKNAGRYTRTTDKEVLSLILDVDVKTGNDQLLRREALLETVAVETEKLEAYVAEHSLPKNMSK